MVCMKIIRKIKHFLFNQLKIIFFYFVKNTRYKHTKINADKIFVHHHMGLGDIIICNGLVNELSEKFEKIYLFTLSKNLAHTEYLYSNNRKIEVLEVDNDKKIYLNHRKYKTLRIGFEKNYGKFNSSFYKQLDLPYKLSFENFLLPENLEQENTLYEHLFKTYNVDKDFVLVHNKSSKGSINLKINSNLPIIYVEKETDLFNNIFLYKKLIENASEIHCIDSSFLHLVERINTNAKLFFHAYKKEGQISEKLELYKNWNIII